MVGVATAANRRLAVSSVAPIRPGIDAPCVLARLGSRRPGHHGDIDQSSRVVALMLRHPGYTRERIAQVGRPDPRADPRRRASPPSGWPWPGRSTASSRPRPSCSTTATASWASTFGPLWATYWFQVEATVPERVARRARRPAVGQPQRGHAVDRRPRAPGPEHQPGRRPRRRHAARSAAAAGERLDLRVELACNGQFGELPGPTPAVEPVVLDRCQIARFDPRAWQLHHDFDVLRRLEAEHANGLDPTWAGELLSELNRFCNVWSRTTARPGTRPRRSWRRCSSAATPRSRTSCRRSATPTSTPPGCGRWPRRYRKCVRTLQLAGSPTWTAIPSSGSPARRPSSTTGSGAATPICTSASAHASSAGQWMPVGGTWVEPDCNLPSGESLVRQFLLRPALLRARVRPPLPRVLEPRRVRLQRPAAADHARRRASTASSPRSCPGTGSTRPPHHTFTWQGIDGSRGADALPAGRHLQRRPPTVAELRRSARDYKDHDRSRHSLLLFGYGDGGGGPTPDMLEMLRRARDLQGLPRTTITHQRRVLRPRSRPMPPTCPTIVGELYFEYHRGTYTIAGRCQARQPRRASGCCTTSSSWPPSRTREAGAALSRASGWTSSGSCCC